MPARKYLPTQLLLFVILVNGIFTVKGQNVPITEQIIYDTVLVYDTIPVYDTIWEYEIVYDTLWLIDPDKEDSTTLKPIDAIKARQVYFSPYRFSCPGLTVKPIAVVKKSSASKNWQAKWKSGLRKIKNGPTNGRSSGYSPPKLTLNPAKGTFNPRAFINGDWSLEAYYGKNFQQNRIKFDDNALQLRSINDSIKYMSGNDYGVRINYSIYQLSLQSGLGFSAYPSEFRYSLIETRVDTVPHLIPNPDPKIHDSILYYTYDTTFLVYPQKSKNTYTYFEIPLIVSYAFYLGRSELNIKAGGINQFNLSNKGEMFTDSLKVIDVKSVNHFSPYVFSLYGGIGYQYYLTNNVSFGFDAFYKHPLKEYAKGLGAHWLRYSYGINFSVRYKF